MILNFTDAVSVSGTRKRDDGYLVVDAKVARTGIQHYVGSEVGRPELPLVRVYRPPEEVFSKDSMISFTHRPITDDHPTEPVTADNWKEFARGQTSDEVSRDGEFIRVPLMVADASTISKIETGKRELSVGYNCDLKFDQGVSPEGETYDAVQTNIRANHIAVVQAGRAGKECRIGDGSAVKWGLKPVEKLRLENMRNIMVDGLPVQVGDASEIVINKLIADRDKALAENSNLKAQFDKALAEKEKELAKKDAALEDVKSKVLDQSGIDELVAKRVALETTAKSICKDVKTAGVSDYDLKKSVVEAKLGDDALKIADGKDETYRQAFIDARYAILVEDAKKADQFRDTMNGVKPVIANDAVAKRQAAFDALVRFDQTGSTDVKVN